MEEKQIVWVAAYPVPLDTSLFSYREKKKNDAWRRVADLADFFVYKPKKIKDQFSVKIFFMFCIVNTLNLIVMYKKYMITNDYLKNS